MSDGSSPHPALGNSPGMSLMSAHSAWTDSWKTPQDDNPAPPGDPETPQQEVRISVELLETLESEDPGAHGDYSPNVFVATLPVFGRVHLLKSKWGFLPVAFIVFYWVYGSWSTLFVILKPQYDDGNISPLPLVYYCIVSTLCISAFFKSVTSNPGRIPFSREPVASPEQMTDGHCDVCRRRRPHRSHHCRRCGQCILRMDHHCPWINNCVGEENHWLFLQLLWYAFLMSASTLVFCLCQVYYWPQCVTCNKDSFTSVHGTGLLAGGFIISIFMSIFSSILITQQTISSLFESWRAGDAGDAIWWLSTGMALGMMGGAGLLLFLHLMGAVRGCVSLVTSMLAVVMAVTSLVLVCAHVLGIRTDMTTIDWMKLQQEISARGKMDMKDVPKVKKTCLQAHDDLCGAGSRLMWPLPCRRRHGPLYVSYQEVV